MTKDEMIATACSNYSMGAMDLFAADVPRGLSDPATWFIYDLPMAAHGFLAYMLEIYLIMAADLGALDVVHAFFTSFARGDGEVFDLTDALSRHGDALPAPLAPRAGAGECARAGGRPGRGGRAPRQYALVASIFSAPFLAHIF